MDTVLERLDEVERLAAEVEAIIETSDFDGKVHETLSAILSESSLPAIGKDDDKLKAIESEGEQSLTLASAYLGVIEYFASTPRLLHPESRAGLVERIFAGAQTNLKRAFSAYYAGQEKGLIEVGNLTERQQTLSELYSSVSRKVADVSPLAASLIVSEKKRGNVNNPELIKNVAEQCLGIAKSNVLLASFSLREMFLTSILRDPEIEDGEDELRMDERREEATRGINDAREFINLARQLSI